MVRDWNRSPGQSSNGAIAGAEDEENHVRVVGLSCCGVGFVRRASGRHDGRKESAEQACAGSRAGDGREEVVVKESSARCESNSEAESKNATVKGLSSEENGKTVYKLETLVNGRTRLDDRCGRQGHVVEEQLDIDKAPAPVRAALEAEARSTLESV
jgi:hypothetical protein